jgi:hypothetical protein
LIEQRLIEKKEDFFGEKPHQNAPWYICAWILNEYVTKGIHPDAC